VKTDAGENTVDISGSSAVSPMAIKRGGFLLFAASQATWMPGGCMLRRCSFTSECLTLRQLEQVSSQNRLASARIRDYLTELLPQQELSLTPVLRKKAMPFWLSPWFLAEFGQVVFQMDGGDPLQAFQVFIFAAEQLFAEKGEAARASGIL
ncbi:unnamed protein product, partial [Polarella glacialis]